MASTSTKLGNIINPEVMGDMIEAKIEAQCKLTPYAKVDTTLQGVAGDTKTVPAWGYIGDAVDFDPESAYDNNGEIETTKLTATSRTFTIKCAGKSVSILQTAINSGLGDPVGQANTQLAKSIVNKVDNDVLSAIYGAEDDGSYPAIVANETAGTISYARIVDAVVKFEDEEDGVDKVMFIHPLQAQALLTDSQFISADKFVAGVAVTGAIGQIAGCWIKKSKKVQKMDAVTAVKGVYTVEFGGTVASADVVKVAGVTVTLDATSGASTTACATAVKNAFSGNDTYSATSSGAVVTLTEKTGKEGSGVPVATITSTAGTVEVDITTEGVASFPACYVNPIIKCEPDSAETEYTEDELPAVTIFLKKDTQVDHEWFPKKQKHDITATKYYGVAVTNSAKVILAKFGVA